MSPDHPSNARRWSKRALTEAAARSSFIRRIFGKLGFSLSRVARAGEILGETRTGHRSAEVDPALYEGGYFGVGRDPGGDREGHSGYATYDRVSSNADIAAFLLWRNFRVKKSLDVGCATGYLVEALRERGIDAHGSDVSAYAIDHAAPGAKGFLHLGDLRHGLPFADHEFELVTTLEILEHLPTEDVPAAIAELRRVCGGILYATIPSFGSNASGPDGHLDGKVRPERLDHYNSLPTPFDRPIPIDDLARDADGGLVEGHLTIAPFEWWTARFSDAGFVRWTDVERRLYADIEPAGLAPFWNLYVFATPDSDPSKAEPREPGKALRELGLIHPLTEHHASLAESAASTTHRASSGVAGVTPETP